MSLPIHIGHKTIDLQVYPHMLVGGTTGSGKSTFLNSLIEQLRWEENVKLLLIDPKRTEFTQWKGKVETVVCDPEMASLTLRWLVAEMERRFKNVESTPQIVCIIDELADLMYLTNGNLEGVLWRLTALGRACGIHLILATQSPRVAVIPGSLKANIPVRIAFHTTTASESRIILDRKGAEELDMTGHALGLLPELTEVRI